MRLVIASNRLPFTVSIKDGQPQFAPSAGGLTTGLWSYLNRARADPGARLDFLWVGWPGANIAPEQQAAVRKFGQAQFNAAPVFLPEESMDRFYLGFCNRTLWPLFHYFTTLAQFDEDHWEGGQARQSCFCRRVGGSVAAG